MADRLGISRVAVTKLEHAEVRGAITIAKLAEVAEALDCQVVYILVPNSSLDETVRRRATEVLERRAEYVGATMALEDQAVNPNDRQRLKDQLVDAAIDSGDLWRT